MDSCVWHKDGHNFEDHKYWETSCDNIFQFTRTEGPTDRHFKFCPYCGKPIEEKQ